MPAYFRNLLHRKFRKYAGIQMPVQNVVLFKPGYGTKGKKNKNYDMINPNQIGCTNKEVKRKKKKKKKKNRIEKFEV